MTHTLKSKFNKALRRARRAHRVRRRQRRRVGTSIIKLKNKMERGWRALRETERQADAEIQAHVCIHRHTQPMSERGREEWEEET